MNSQSVATDGGTNRSSSKSLQCGGGALSHDHPLLKIFFRQPWNLFLATFLRDQYMEITSILPALPSISLSLPIS